MDELQGMSWNMDAVFLPVPEIRSNYTDWKMLNYHALAALFENRYIGNAKFLSLNVYLDEQVTPGEASFCQRPVDQNPIYCQKKVAAGGNPDVEMVFNIAVNPSDRKRICDHDMTIWGPIFNTLMTGSGVTDDEHIRHYIRFDERCKQLQDEGYQYAGLMHPNCDFHRGKDGRIAIFYREKSIEESVNIPKIPAAVRAAVTVANVIGEIKKVIPINIELDPDDPNPEGTAEFIRQVLLGKEPGTLHVDSGKSAYDIAVEQGYVGTRKQWLSTIRMGR